MSADVVFRAFHYAPADPGSLDRAELERAAAMLPDVRNRFLSGRAAQRRWVAELLGVPASELTVHYRCPRCGSGPDVPHGRPGYSLDGTVVPLLLSLSRAAGWTLMAAVVKPAPGVRLGVDVEDPRRMDFPGFDAIALTESERSSLASLAGGELLVERTRLWARKEAWLKMTGEGLLVSPATVDVRVRPQIQDLQPAATGLPGGLVAAVALS
ncbi:4'-phosphopantetheinyl transferase family protein [Pseudarthrobacter sp. N5]|uniref:4'-phosphopantetheinyl transferase family protein n=1 Tax=Pseudarthrobacter sp. N5 TaxID=3418416 RepID=UPI003CF2D2CE